MVRSSRDGSSEHGAKIRCARAALLAGAAAIALSAQPARAEDGKWQGHGEIAVRPGTDRTSGQLELFLPVWQDDTSLIFGDLRGLGDTDNAIEGSGGLGYRTLTGDGWILGGYLFGDARHTDDGNVFWQGGAGLEALSEDFDFRVNGYIPEDKEERTDKKLIWIDPLRPRGRTDYETALWGMDGEVGVLLPGVLEETRAYVGGFYFDAYDDRVDAEWGPKARIETRLSDMSWLGAGSRLTLGVEGEYDVEGDDPEGRGLIRLRVPFGAPEAGAPLTPLERRMTETVVRDIDVRIEDYSRTERLGVKYPKTDRGFDQFYHLTANGDGVGTIEDPTDFMNGTQDGLFGDDDVLLVDGDNGPIPTNFVMNQGQYIVGGGGHLDLYGIKTGQYFTTIWSPGSTPVLRDASNGMLPVLTGANDTQIQQVIVEGGRDGIVYRNADDFMVLDTVIRDVRANHLANVMGTDDGMVIDHSSNGMVMNVAVFNLMGPDADGFDIDASRDLLLQDVTVRDVYSEADGTISATFNEATGHLDISVDLLADGDGVDIDDSTNITIQGLHVDNVVSFGGVGIEATVTRNEDFAFSTANVVDGDTMAVAMAAQSNAVGNGVSLTLDVSVVADGDAVDVDNSSKITIADAWIGNIRSETGFQGSFALNQILSGAGGAASAIANAVDIVNDGESAAAANAAGMSRVAADLPIGSDVSVTLLSEGDAIDVDNSQWIKIGGLRVDGVTSDSQLRVDQISGVNAVAMSRGFGLANALSVSNTGFDGATAIANAAGSGSDAAATTVNMALDLTAEADGDGVDLTNIGDALIQGASISSILSSSAVSATTDVGIRVDAGVVGNALALANEQVGNISSIEDASAHAVADANSQAGAGLTIGADLELDIQSLADGDGIHVADSRRVVVDNAVVWGVSSTAVTVDVVDVDVDVRTGAMGLGNAAGRTSAEALGDLGTISYANSETAAGAGARGNVEVGIGVNYSEVVAVAGGDGFDVDDSALVAILHSAASGIVSNAAVDQSTRINVDAHLGLVQADAQAAADGEAFGEEEVALANAGATARGAAGVNVLVDVFGLTDASADGDGVDLTGVTHAAVFDVAVSDIFSTATANDQLAVSVNVDAASDARATVLAGASAFDFSDESATANTQAATGVSVNVHSDREVGAFGDGDGFQVGLNSVGVLLSHVTADNIVSGGVTAVGQGVFDIDVNAAAGASSLVSGMGPGFQSRQNADADIDVRVDSAVDVLGLADGDGFDVFDSGAVAIIHAAASNITSSGATGTADETIMVNADASSLVLGEVPGNGTAVVNVVHQVSAEGLADGDGYQFFNIHGPSLSQVVDELVWELPLGLGWGYGANDMAGLWGEMDGLMNGADGWSSGPGAAVIDASATNIRSENASSTAVSAVVVEANAPGFAGVNVAAHVDSTGAADGDGLDVDLADLFLVKKLDVRNVWSGNASSTAVSAANVLAVSGGAAVMNVQSRMGLLALVDGDGMDADRVNGLAVVGLSVDNVTSVDVHTNSLFDFHLNAQAPDDMAAVFANAMLQEGGELDGDGLDIDDSLGVLTKHVAINDIFSGGTTDIVDNAVLVAQSTNGAGLAVVIVNGFYPTDGDGVDIDNTSVGLMLDTTVTDVHHNSSGGTIVDAGGHSGNVAGDIFSSSLLVGDANGLDFDKATGFAVKGLAVDNIDDDGFDITDSHHILVHDYAITNVGHHFIVVDPSNDITFLDGVMDNSGFDGVIIRDSTFVTFANVAISNVAIGDGVNVSNEPGIPTHNVLLQNLSITTVQDDGIDVEPPLSYTTSPPNPASEVVIVNPSFSGIGDQDIEGTQD